MVEYLSAEAVEKIAEANGGWDRVVVVNNKKAGTLAFKVPDDASWARFQSELIGDVPAKKAAATKTLCISNVVYPERAVFQELIAKYPGVPMSTLSHISEAAGSESEAYEKK